LITFLFEFVYGLEQAIYTLVCNMWTKNYKLNTKHDIGGVVAEDIREGEIGSGSIPNN
jgi:hypothetical protein